MASPQETKDFFDHLPVLLAILVPVVSAAGSWGGTKWALKHITTEIKDIKEKLDRRARVEDITIMKNDIAELKKEVSDRVETDECKEDRRCCVLDRNEYRNSLSCQISELSSSLKVADSKRHDHNNKVQAMWGEILQRITAVETCLEERRFHNRRSMDE